MGWSINYYYALRGKNDVIQYIKEFIGRFNDNSKDGPKQWRLHDLRVALYGNIAQENDNRKICHGPGRIYELRMDEKGVLWFSIETYKNFFESKVFLRKLRRKFGKFRYDVCVDDTELFQDAVLYTTDRTGDFFPHFTVVVGQPSAFENWPYCNSDTPQFICRNTRELVREFRKRGFAVQSFKEILDKYPRLYACKDDVALGVWPTESPCQKIPRKLFF